MFRLDDVYYAPIHKWKLGEVQAHGSIEDALSSRTLPIFVIPPSQEYDYDRLQTVTLVEHLKNFGARLKAHRGDRPALIDANLLDTPEIEDLIGGHPLTALLERARQCHAHAYPLITTDSSEGYLYAARSFLSRHDHVGFGLRLRLSELDNPGWFATVERLVAATNQRPAKGVLVVDSGPLFGWDDGLVDIVINRLNHMPFLSDWGAVFFASTAFPEKRATPIGETGRFLRQDKDLFKAILARGEELTRLPRFSDYAMEYPSKFRRGGGTPKAHLRFTSESHYLISEGATTKGNGFSAIYAVASDLVKQEEFKKAPPSDGKTFFEELSHSIGPGNPSKWRWGATDHHLTVIVHEQSQLFEFSVVPEPAIAEPQQVSLPGFDPAVHVK